MLSTSEPNDNQKSLHTEPEVSNAKRDSPRNDLLDSSIKTGNSIFDHFILCDSHFSLFFYFQSWSKF